ncbi:ankyrin repeat-containing protein [Anaeramoeba flamelloides]|uniref:Ankyrin repeat-containing protein n=1 Tax=Anaeramoeba flamelloides TaxID=1746091 RepID=A0ABQ8XGW9_9EUKA|nr:ankyrin repeat-containing protein [Anaeramoeba flamelloides]
MEGFAIKRRRTRSTSSNSIYFQQSLLKNLTVGSLSKLRKLITKKNYHQTDKKGRNVLQILLSKRSVKTKNYDYLLELGCDLSHQDAKGDTIFHLLLQEKSPRYGLINYFLDSKNEKDLDLLNDEGIPAIFLLFRKTGKSGFNYELFGKMLSKMKRISATDQSNKGQNIYHLLIGLNLKEQHYDLIDQCYRKGAEVNGTDSSGRNALVSLCLQDKPNFTLIKKFVKYRSVLNTICAQTVTALNSLCQKENVDLEIVEYLLKKGANADFPRNKTGKDGPAHIACESANEINFELLKLLRQYGCNFEKEGLQGLDVLQLCCERENPNYEILEWLIKEVKVDIHSERSKDSRTALHILSSKHNIPLKFLRLVLENDPDPNRLGPDNSSAIHFLAASNPQDLEYFQLLIDYKVDVKAQDLDGWGLLHYLVDNEINLQFLKFFLDKGLPLNQKNAKDETPLHILCQNYSSTVEHFKYFFEYGADAKLKNINNQTTLHLVCQSTQDLETIQLLVKMGCAIDDLDNFQYTPLSYLCEHNPMYNLETCKYLIGEGADVNKVNQDNGETCLSLACSSEDTNMPLLNLLLEKGSNLRLASNKRQTTKLAQYKLLMSHNFNAFDLLLKYNYQINDSIASYTVNTILALMAPTNDYEVIKHLLEKNADPNSHHPVITSSWAAGFVQTPSKYPSYEVLKLFIKYNANVNQAIIHTGKTPLIKYCSSHIQKDGIEKIKLLIENGADVNQQTTNKKTALMCLTKRIETLIRWRFIDY